MQPNYPIVYYTCWPNPVSEMNPIELRDVLMGGGVDDSDLRMRPELVEVDEYNPYIIRLEVRASTIVREVTFKEYIEHSKCIAILKKAEAQQAKER